VTGSAKDTLKRTAWTFVQAFLAAVVILLPGILAAPNLSEAKGLVTAALVAGLAAGLSALKNLAVTGRAR
jgi:hypothetical protein